MTRAVSEAISLVESFMKPHSRDANSLSAIKEVLLSSTNIPSVVQFSQIPEALRLLSEEMARKVFGDNNVALKWVEDIYNSGHLPNDMIILNILKANNDRYQIAKNAEYFGSMRK